MTDWQCHLLSCPGQLKTPQYYFKIDFEDSITWSDISNKAILPCLNCVRTPESEQEVVIIDFGIIPGGEMISSLGTFPITLTYCIILWKPLFIFLLFFDTAVFYLFLSILLTYFHIFSTGFLLFLTYSLIWCIHDCSLSLNIYTTYHCKCKICCPQKSTTKCTNATLLSIHPPFSHQVLGNPPQILFLSGPGDSLKLSPEFLLTGCWNLTELV